MAGPDKSLWARGTAVIYGRREIAWLMAWAMAWVMAWATPAWSLQLITAQEAALPAAASPLFQQAGPTRRPRIVVVSPPVGAGLMHSPVHLKLRFEAFGGVSIDPESVLVTYEKTPAIDLTQRLMPFITADGIDVPDAEVPPGEHLIWVQLKDKGGRPGGADIRFQISN